MRALTRFLTQFLVIFMMLSPSLAMAQGVTAKEKVEIADRIQEIVEAVNEGDAQPILDMMSSEADNLLVQEIEDAIAGKSITFEESIVSFNKSTDDEVVVVGRFSAEGVSWNIEGFSNAFTFVEEGQDWNLLTTDFHRQWSSSTLMTFFLKMGAMILIPMILLFIFWIWMLVDAINRPLESKTLWIIVIIFLNFLGSVLYFLIPRRRHKAASGERSSMLESAFLSFTTLVILGSISYAGYFIWSQVKDFNPEEVVERIEREIEVAELDEENQEEEEEKDSEESSDESEEEEEEEEEKDETSEEEREEPEEKEAEKEVEPEGDPGANARGDRIYLDDNTNVFVDYKSGDTLQLTKNAGTTRGCGSKILYYKDPILSDDSQFAILPLYCEGDPTEVWVKELKTLRSGLVAYGESGSFVEQDGVQMIKIGENLHENIMNRQMTLYNPAIGLSVTFEDGYKQGQDGYLFGPKTPNLYDPRIPDEHSYWLQITPARSAQDITDYLEGLGSVSEGPTLITLNGNQVMKYRIQEMCDDAIMEVIGQKSNYVFQPSCGDGSTAEWSVLEKAVKAVKLIK